MNLIYYCSKYSDAPSMVSKSIFMELLSLKGSLPFQYILLSGEKPSYEFMQKHGLQIFSWFNFVRNKNCLVHIAISPNIFPNHKFLLIMCSLFLKRPLILHYHGDVRMHLMYIRQHNKKASISDRINSLCVPFLLKFPTRVVVHSYSMKQILLNYGVKQSVVIPNGVDEFWFNSVEYDQVNVKSKSAIRNKSMVKKVFYHGRLSPEKGVDLLLNAFSSYLKSDSTAHLFLAGDGAHHDDLIQLASSLGVNKNISFLGHLEKDDIKYFLKNVDIAIYPSLFDAFCLAAVEALASSNCPVYFSKYAGINDFAIENGLNSNSFVPNVESILNILHKTSYSVDATLLEKQKNFANNFRWDLLANDYIYLYKDVISNANA
ncbi:Glycosyltransferase involved in cell wall bisynthesis [Methanolobus vulcani]|uniref:Glycosyltransferase involved in cell wall bisynthesis n=1 Tax=Methanolobus vulcani TaxID=38026 RepID=A0A7Z7AVB5_9EURY|nr:glycosyltransferase family 4 protein [Methanolobus vulcani]SDF24582.1 Glycosyltransferase involved in cell wall bisynthesis [Methanolobus vulcani]